MAKVSEKLNPSTRLVAYGDAVPVTEGAFVAPTASIIGDVTLEKGASVWYGATLRGDVGSITVGERSSIGERAVVHVSKIQTEDNESVPTSIGKGCSIQANALVHAATLKDYCRIGPCAQVLDGAVVGEHAVVEAGAVVTPGSVVKEGEVWAGAPAKMVRTLSEEEMKAMEQDVEETMELAAVHASECAKDYEQIKEEEDEYYDKLYRDPDYFQKIPKDELKADGDVLGRGMPGRIFNTELSHKKEDGKIHMT